MMGSLWGSEDKHNSNVIILTKDSIHTFNASTIVELLNLLPGISASESGPVGMGGFYASDIIVTLDGRPINDQTTTSKYVKWSEVDFYSIDKIEIYKISSRCAGGEIKIFTQKGGNKRGGQIKTWVGDNDYKSINASYNLSKGPFYWNLSHNYNTKGEHHHNNNDKQRNGSTVQMCWEKDFTISSSFSYLKEEAGSALWSYGVPDCSRPKKDKNYFPEPNKPLSRKELNSLGTVLNINIKDLYSEFFFNNHQKENWQTGVKKDSDGNIVYVVDTNNQVFTTPYRGRNEVNVKEFGGDAGVRKKNYNVGFRAINYVCDFSKTSNATGIMSKGAANEYLLDLSGAWSWKGLTLSTNLFYHKEFGINIFPKIAFGQSFKPLYYDISFTSTKKYPSFFERYFSTGSTRANQNLKPQTNLCATLKIGSKYQLSGYKIEWQLAPYFNKAYNKTYTHTYFKTDTNNVPLIDSLSGKTIVDYRQYENLEKAYWTGIDIILKQKFREWGGIDGCFTIKRTFDEVHNSSFAYIAPYVFKGNVFIKPLKNLCLNLRYTYYSGKYADQAETYEMLWYHYLNFKTDYLLKKNTKLFLEIKNLTDFDYYVYRGYPGSSRQWWVGIETKI